VVERALGQVPDAAMGFFIPQIHGKGIRKIGVRQPA